ncbi:MAG TPA: OB-fold nucleic acid binding domain-containing protein [Nitrospira sp.]|nr:OB-fold nucleic acid binding domain-containing protein [Nitrospira sp.]
MLPPAIARGSVLQTYGQASLMLEDETGSLPVYVLGSCRGAVEALPKDVDRVRVTGLVQALKREAPRDVRVQATQIHILESN